MQSLTLPKNPNATDCRKKLSSLSSRREKRKGKISYLIGIIFIGLTLILAICLILGLVFEAPFYAFLIVMVPSLMLYYFLIGREQALCFQNVVDHVAEYVSPHLQDEEKILCIFNGKAQSLNVPDWLLDEFYGYAIFVFTTDRIIILSISSARAGVGNIVDPIKNGHIESLIQNMFVCDPSDKTACRFGGAIPAFVLHLCYTKIKLQPINHRENFTWIISHKGTRAGTVLGEMFAGLSS